MTKRKTKIIVALLLFLSMILFPGAAYDEAGQITDTIVDFSPATPTDLEPVIYDYTITRSNMPQYSIVAFGNATITGHIRGSIYVGGTLMGNQYVDDGSIDGVAASDSYVRINESEINFKGRTSEQGKDSYRVVSQNSVASTANYWREFITTLPTNTAPYIYLQPDENGTVSFGNYEYQANGSDIAYRTINTVYWTDATTVNMAGMAGHLIAPYATVNVPNCNFCGSIVAKNVVCSGEAHINTYVPPTPEPEPSPTPEPVDITLNKTLIGSVWHVRCDYMDGITFTAGGGFWRRDWITNYEGKTSKEGHRSNKCGDADHWVIWVDADGNPFRMDEIKSGATGGTLPTVIYEPRYSFTHDEILAMESGDLDLIWKYSQNFIDLKDWSTIKIGERIYWTTSNNGQVWYHTGIPYKVDSPTYTIYIDGEGYDLVSNGGAVTIEDLEAGVHTIVEEKYGDTYVSNIYVDGVALSDYTGSIEITADTHITVENTLITPPPTSSPTPPPTPVVPTPTPTPSPTPTATPEESPTPTPTTTPEESPTPTPTTTPEESPTPTPTPSESPTPTPTITPEESPTPTPEVTVTPTPTPTVTPELVGFTIRKIVNGELSENAIFFFKITGPEDYEEYYEVIVEAETGKGEIFIDDLHAGKYTVEEVDIPEGFVIVSEESITKYIVGIEMEFEFINELEPTPTPTPTLEPTPTPTATPTDLPPTLPPTTPPTTVTPSEVPVTPTPPLPTPTPTPEFTTTPIPSEVVSPTPTPEPTPTPTPTPEPTEEPEPIMKELTLIKVWHDNNNEENIRPGHIVVDLYANDILIQTITSSQETFVIEVPVYDDEENEIKYTWREHEVIGYTLKSQTISGDTTVLVNAIIEIPKVPPEMKQPKTPTRSMYTMEIDDYTVALGVNVIINHVGDCFD